ncbi:helix-turn-helix transcriptional regulator [Conexibacter sp. JD483]|uniref:helix-turn-helix transcriptional regulator n=1 Tax=unclassified Conexibacter TaxID=2627773 RepID=UPI00271A889E|nr:MULTISPECIES: helix-turn-helix transcriptional regulator [unclassified Conexibacter]MDO8186654.1 helix-turn-helix transcriptional regulator [Conexibacter sp. CPCC 205706]MDO8200374.1 helix-turn-helix transcriptional regulator [Conexibacter sp. CPCC 205762]MDR9370604.1 helix-turn-helix transcriptional regulator [Conexibacter sp. JD483]
MSPASVYRELPPRAELRDLLACRWEQHVAPARRQRVVPDGCVDVVWVAGRELVVAGPATRAMIAALPPGSTTVGLRFATGAAAGPLGLPLTALRDARVPLAELWGAAAVAPLEAALAEAGSAPQQLDLLERALLARRADTPPVDRLALAAVGALGGACDTRARDLGPAGRARAAGLASVPGHPPRARDLAAALGVSERQLLRRLRTAVGYGPATLTRVLRLQRALRAAWSDPARALSGGLGRIAADAGYADQPHFARDCHELTGVAPTTLLRGG